MLINHWSVCTTGQCENTKISPRSNRPFQFKLVTASSLVKPTYTCVWMKPKFLENIFASIQERPDQKLQQQSFQVITVNSVSKS